MISGGMSILTVSIRADQMKPLVLNRRQVREVDRRAIEEYGISGAVLMENAGRGVADVLCDLGIDGPVVIACGKGNNAGDGFVIARHLDLRGQVVRVLLWADPNDLTGDARTNFEILSKTDVPIDRIGVGIDGAKLLHTLNGADWIVDALLGTGAQGQPRPPIDAAINMLNDVEAKRLAVDVPSGLDCDTGVAATATFRAEHTCTFVALKPAFDQPVAAQFTGKVHVLDIGVPPRLIRDMAAITA